MVGCDKGLDIPTRPNLLKVDLSFPIYESTVPAAKRFGQLQIFLEHEEKWSFRFPAESLLIKNVMISSAVAAEASWRAPGRKGNLRAELPTNPYGVHKVCSYKTVGGL